MKKKFKLFTFIIIMLLLASVVFIYYSYFRLNANESFILKAVLKEAKNEKVVSVLGAQKCYKNFGKVKIQYEADDGGLFSENQFIYNDEIYYYISKPFYKSNCLLLKSGKIICSEPQDDTQLSQEEKKEIDDIYLIYNRQETIKSTCKENSIKITKRGLNKINRILKNN